MLNTIFTIVNVHSPRKIIWKSSGAPWTIINVQSTSLMAAVASRKPTSWRDAMSAKPLWKPPSDVKIGQIQ
jgi:hypothetical protein